MENLQNQCPYCGGDWKKEANHNGLEQWKCKNCGYEIIVKNENDLKAILALSTFSDKVISLLHAKQNGGKSERIKKWRENDKEFQKIIDDYGGALAKDPLFAMAHAAHMTDGFELYEPKSEKVTVEALYSVANEYVKNNPSAKNIKELITLYRRKLRNKTKNALIIVLSAVVVCIAACFTALSLYSPMPLDEKSGITVSVPSGSVSVFNKFGVDINVEEQSSTSPAYIDAKNALRNETDKFVLYDLFLINGSKALDFDGSVKVTIPIPEGYQTGALKIFHVISDEEYEEIPSTVSEADNTISFETTHFSLYAVAERHPIVTFDSDGGNEIERQIVQRDSLAKKPEDPEKQGYTFGGWMNGKEAWNFDIDTVKKDVNLTAKWIANEYTVTLIANGGNISSETLKVSYMSAYSELPENVVKAGYTFLGWYTAESNGTKVTAATIMQMAADHTLYAIFDENVNKVVFNANGGSGNMADFELKTGETARLPQNLFNRTGYVFMGWSSGSTGDVLWGDKSEYTMGTDSSYTLYAVWVINTNVLKFDANGGTGTMAPISMNYQSEQRLPENTFIRSGYKFVGWSTSAQGLKEYDDKSIYVMGDKAENVLYAVWEKKTNKLHFDANGGIGSMNYISAEYQAPIQLPNCEFTRDGFEFAGWSTVPNGSPVTEFSMGADDDQTLYACWRALENPFTFNANGGEGNMETGFTIETGGKANLPKNKFTRVGYKFIGWSTDAYGTVKYVDEAVFEMNKHGEVTLYAVWEKISYNITYENIKSGDNSKNITSFDIETYFELKNISSAGYIFDGWYDIDGNKVEIIDDRTGDIILKAKWSLETYNIVYNNTKDALNENVVEYNIETANIVLKNIACTGYIFDGWYNQAGERIAEISQGSIGNLVLEAKWSLENYAIEYDNTKDVSNSNDTSYTIESDTITLKPISIVGYDFVGWFDENENLVTEIASGSTGNITLTARWTAITYKIEYKNTKDADNDNVADYTIESSDIELKKISVNGYIFNGWFNQAGEEVKVISKGSINDLVLEARWTPEVYTIEYKNTKNSSNANPTSYNIETRTITLVNLECDGYVFNGWYDASGTKVDEIPVGSIGDITLKAEWSVVNYRIVYNNTKGAENTNLTEFNIKSGDIQLKDISVAGFRFDGWYNTSGTKVTVIPTGSMGEIVLEAKWTANSYIVKYDSNGGTCDMSDSNHTYGDSKKLNANAFTRRGYAFAGWSLSPDGSVVYENLAAVENLTVDNNGVVRLYAQWSCITYEIKFETNGGESIDSIYYTIESAEFNLPATVLMAGKTFIGWYDNAALSGDMVLSIANGTVGNKTYYAKWSNWHTYEIVYDANGGIGVMENSNYTYGVLKKLSGCTFTKQGYKFIGWSTIPDGEVAYENLESVKNLTAENNVEVTLYAQWKAIESTVIFDGNNGTPSQTSKTVVYDDDYGTLPNATRVGYEFLGWYTAKEGGTQITALTVVELVSNQTLYARWSEPLEYKITFNSDGGMTVETITYTVEDLPITLPISNKDGFKFVGWYEGGILSGTPISSISTIGNYELSCQWLSNADYNKCFDSYTVKDDYGSYSYTKSNAETVLAGDIIQMTRIPNKYLYDTASYNFKYVMVAGHWDTDDILTANDISYGGIAIVGTISSNGKLVINSDCPAGTKFTIVILDNNSGNPDYSTYSAERVFHFTVGEKNTNFDGGLGTFNRPYLISQNAQLAKLSQYASEYFALLNDIDWENNSWLSFEFSGVLDGRNYSISNVSITNAIDKIGFFSILNGKISNLTFDNIKVILGSAWLGTSNNYAGVIAGFVSPTGIIDNCIVSNSTVSVSYGYSYDVRVFAGGICGAVQGQIVNTGIIYSDIKAYAKADDKRNDGAVHVGGIAGTIVSDTGTIDNCCSYDNTIYGYIYTNGYKKEGNKAYAYFHLGGLVGSLKEGGKLINSSYYNNKFDHKHEYYDHTAWNDSDYNIKTTYQDAIVGLLTSGTVLQNAEDSERNLP